MSSLSPNIVLSQFEPERWEPIIKYTGAVVVDMIPCILLVFSFVCDIHEYTEIKLIRFLFGFGIILLLTSC